ncbi:homocysteine S-methyltransferase family protein [Fusobacterium mortiferum]|uniref:homocysteine S-methyltransferase family protein n=1 Tax=Fusobacterium mortiferum TaxID=850 RepID=UPI000219BD19|nr:homocysteine S-methyltransferase family protein [Fusobacterium mortiferum]EEO35184.2 5-methyltetrahydrofolate--homocysteine methyltransferase [Fusobacterium mortiferum ATCC 9817]
MDIKKELQKRILVLDGAMGTAIQKYNLNSDDYLGKKGCNEILNITRPDIIKDIHLKYIEAGADIIETNSFNCNKISLNEYGFSERAYEIAKRSAELAKEVTTTSEKKIYIAGSIGPTNKTLTIPSGKNPYDRDLEFDYLKEAYSEQIEGLIDGGVDILLIETIFDGLNAKCAVISAEEVMKRKNINLPIMISATVNKEGKIFTGQSIESLIVALDRESIISYGFNCSFGAKELIPLTKKLGKFTKKPISLYPNAGLPNEDGEYLESPDITANYLKELVDNQEVNILGGCCGTTFEHIKSIANLVKNRAPRKFEENFKLEGFLSGNEILYFNDKFVDVGEKNNVAGSKIFKNLIADKNYIKALEIAKKQIENGAKVIDINMDDGLFESKIEMKNFLIVIQNDRFVSKIPIMIDSSDFEVIETGLKNIAGKSIVNSISLKEGEEEFRKKAQVIKKYGASVVVMAFDEKGQGVSYERKIEICSRAYSILKEIGYSNSDIIFDLNILTIGTGMESDRYNGLNFLKACEWIRKNFKGVGIIGGLSNLSFAFRGNNDLRAGLHSIFLEEGKNRGLNFAILNPNENPPILSLEDKKILRDLIFGEESSLEQILNLHIQRKKEVVIKEELTLEQCIENALIFGETPEFINDINSALKIYSPLDIIQNILMEGMKKLGVLFEKGEVYLPQLIRSSETMNKAVNIITPHLKSDEKVKAKGKILMATVEGDVHDIGKNIVGTVLKCNGYEIIDLGVMVPKETILSTAKEQNVDIITLSGLITPSLKEMEKVLKYFQENSMKTLILIAGATTSPLHTALRLEPLYSGKVLHVSEALDTLQSINKLCSDEREEFLSEKLQNFKTLRKLYEKNKKENIEDTQEILSPVIIPKEIGKKYLEISLEDIEKYINLDILLHTLKVKNSNEELKIKEDLSFIFNKMKENNLKVRGSYGIFSSKKIDGKLIIEDNIISTKEDFIYKFINNDDYIGAFALSYKSEIFKEKEYLKILEELLNNRIVEAGAEYLEDFVSKNIWKINIRPAIGYPSLPNHQLKETVLKILDEDKLDIKLTSSYAMLPLSSVCGLYISNPKSFYKK